MNVEKSNTDTYTHIHFLYTHIHIYPLHTYTHLSPIQIYTHTHIYLLHTHIPYTHTHTYISYTLPSPHTHTYTHVHPLLMYIPIYTYTYTHAHTSIHPLHTHSPIHTHTYIPIHTHTYINIHLLHTYISPSHTHTQSSKDRKSPSQSLDISEKKTQGMVKLSCVTVTLREGIIFLMSSRVSISHAQDTMVEQNPWRSSRDVGVRIQGGSRSQSSAPVTYFLQPPTLDLSSPPCNATIS